MLIVIAVPDMVTSLEQINTSIWHLVHSSSSNFFSSNNYQGSQVSCFLLRGTRVYIHCLASRLCQPFCSVSHHFCHGPQKSWPSWHPTEHPVNIIYDSLMSDPMLNCFSGAESSKSLKVFPLLNFLCWHNQCRFYFPIWHNSKSHFPNQKLWTKCLNQTIIYPQKSEFLYKCQISFVWLIEVSQETFKQILPLVSQLPLAPFYDSEVNSGPLTNFLLSMTQKACCGLNCTDPHS